MVYIVLGVIIIVLVLLLIFKKPKKHRVKATKIGEYGEELVKEEIGHSIDNQQYVINDYFISEGDKSIQIDHIVINPRGIFVIETKNFAGEIYGSDSQQEWTQILADGNVRNTFYNPVKQNATHVYNVIKIIGNLPVNSVVVFVRNNIQFVQSKSVVSLSVLRKVLNEGPEVLSVSQMEQAYAKLLLKRSYITIEKHVSNIKLQQYKLDMGICPRCGARLVIRRSSSGEFWGCSNYPKCKFTKKIEY
ncbi:MAG: NERD domain-containing protein [Clostridia bacterium]|nr:NERD domain-containing protein [Clostridia bacterium]